MMNLWLPLLPYLLIVAMTMAVLGLFYGISRRVERIRKKVTECEAAIAARSSDFANGLVELKRTMAEWETGGEGHAASQAGRVTGLSNSLRGKVLKMHRLGQPADRIAETLLVPKGEVDLLVKVHQVVMRPYAEVPPLDHAK